MFHTLSRHKRMSHKERQGESRVREIRMHGLVEEVSLKKRNLLRSMGFTLLELLIVIVIISILVGMLLPALNKSRGKGKQITCLNKMKQFGLAIHYYANDYNDVFVPYYFNGGQMWSQALSVYLERNVSDPYLGKFSKCAEETSSIGAIYGSPFLWLGVTQYKRPGGGYSSSDNCPLKFNKIKKPSAWGAMTDVKRDLAKMYTPAGIADQWKFDTDIDGDGNLDTKGSTNTIYNDGRPKTHGGGSNFLMCGGNAKWVPLSQWVNMKDEIWTGGEIFPYH